MAGDDVSHIIVCPFVVDLSEDTVGRRTIFGTGAWSKVYRGVGRLIIKPSIPATNDILTPPPSPETSVPLLVAVKTPLSKASRIILENEAITLSHLTRAPFHEGFIVPFYGYIPSSASLVLAPIPLPLSDHIFDHVGLAVASTVDLLSTEPVLGSSPVWLNLADKLITALAWLHETAGVVHGDVKPGNILLSPNRSADHFPFDPLLVDFSSSHILSSENTPPNTLSAITREYTAPELLSPSVLRDPSSTATTASDVFSLAITLIVAATGDLMVYQGNVWQRQHFATQGFNVLDFVRCGENGIRVPSGGVVERLVEPAVRKVNKGRIDAGKWRDFVRGIVLEQQEGTTGR
jgi:serine/threonine protein kinase